MIEKIEKALRLEGVEALFPHRTVVPPVVPEASIFLLTRATIQVSSTREVREAKGAWIAR